MRRRRRERRRDRRRRHDPASPLTLDAVTGGTAVRVVRVGGERRTIHRLAALGLVPGATITVTRPRGPAIVSVGGARVAVGWQAARLIEVEEAAR